jgi:hypothetical protein
MFMMMYFNFFMKISRHGSKCRNAGLSGIQGVRYWNEKKLTVLEPVWYYFFFIQYLGVMAVLD